MVDGILFVVREGKTSTKGLREAFEMLQDSPVLGVILNDASVDNLRGRYRYYQDYYGYQERTNTQA